MALFCILVYKIEQLFTFQETYVLVLSLKIIILTNTGEVITVCSCVCTPYVAYALLSNKFVKYRVILPWEAVVCIDFGGDADILNLLLYNFL